MWKFIERRRHFHPPRSYSPAWTHRHSRMKLSVIAHMEPHICDILYTTLDGHGLMKGERMLLMNSFVDECSSQLLKKNFDRQNRQLLRPRKIFQAHFARLSCDCIFVILSLPLFFLGKFLEIGHISRCPWLCPSHFLVAGTRSGRAF